MKTANELLKLYQTTVAEQGPDEAQRYYDELANRYFELTKASGAMDSEYEPEIMAKFLTKVACNETSIPRSHS